MSEDLKPIPIAAAKRIADEFGYHQVVIVARHVGAAGGEHVTTYGVDVAHCGVAAKMGNFFKYKLMGWPPPEHEDSPFSQAARDVLAERRRQVEVEGWTTGHDDQHVDGDLAVVAACYAISGGDEPPPMWPWDPSWWKPEGDRRNLVKAASLIIAEIERRDRAAARQAAEVRNG